jgi:hypothetical protein
MTKFRVLAGLMLAFFASSAFAQVTSGQPVNGAASDLFVVVINQTTNATEMVDLGVLPTSLTSGQTWTVDPSLVGAGTIVFQLVGGDWSNLTGTYATDVLWSSSTNPAFAFRGDSTQTAVSNFDTYLGNFAASFRANALNNGMQTYSVAGTSASRWTATGLGIANFNAAGAIGSPLDLYSYTVTNDLNTAPATAVKVGSFSLVGTTLTFTGLSSVPVPAALWLLASGILGLGAAGRRRVAV